MSELEVTRFDRAEGYWTPRGWSERGPVKLQSRIDVPRAGAQVAAGDAVIAGVAWHNHVGVAGVEVQIDDGPWQPATLASAISADTWVQWSLPWDATTRLAHRALPRDLGRRQHADLRHRPAGPRRRDGLGRDDGLGRLTLTREVPGATPKRRFPAPRDGEGSQAASTCLSCSTAQSSSVARMVRGGAMRIV